MIGFWIAAFLATAAAAALVVAYARRPVRILADPTQTVYARQLEEIDDLADRGLMAEDEVKSARAEAGRRLLGEKPAPAEAATTPQGARIVAASILGIGAVAVAGYLFVGHPTMPDQPFKKRLAEWSAQDPRTLTPAQLEARLEPMVKAKANDPQGYLYLAQLQAELGDDMTATRNLEKAVALDPSMTEAWNLLGQMRLRMAQNKFTPGARAALQKAAANPSLVAPRYLLGRDAIEQGRRDEGLGLWRALLPTLETGEERDTLAKQIASVEAGGGPIPIEAAAGDPSGNPAIVAMVGRLAARLKENPDDKDGWARLVRSYTVLKDEAKLKETLAAAKVQFKGRPKDLADIEAAANVPQ